MRYLVTRMIPRFLGLTTESLESLRKEIQGEKSRQS